uniref:Glycosyltransferase n=1 Tax=Ananas comosus var. bracteatus TaxID=296719 RepID=A0A6V7QLF3_ANACO|nr:unnamed protein product [Ananas comosus var. bracteatus]
MNIRCSFLHGSYCALPLPRPRSSEPLRLPCRPPPPPPPRAHRHPRLHPSQHRRPPRLPPPDSPLRLHSLPFSPSSHGLPPQAESLAAIPVRQFITFFQASESLRPAFDDFIAGARGSSPLCIVSDYFFGWTVDVARKHGAFHSVFLTTSAFGAATYFSLCTHLPHALTSDDEFPLPDLPDVVVVHRSQLSKYVLAADGTDPFSRFFQAQISFCHATDAVLVNTVEEIEAAAGLRMLRCTLSNAAPVFPVGPLLSASASEHPSSPAASSSEIVEWLDSHPPRSVIYVSFGSQNTIQAAQMTELAMGLEASGRPFVWVVRPPVGFDVTAEFDAEWLPEGFEETTRKEKRGLVIRGWAPQVAILRHESTGAFLSHCGWNSMLEGLIHGVPIIGWPLAGEQFFNATMAAELGVCVEAARGNMESSRVERGRVAEVVGAVMGGRR